VDGLLRHGGASWRPRVFPSSDFFAVVKITRLEPGPAVEWDVTDSKAPGSSGYVDLDDWAGTSIRFDMEPLHADRTR
jgi:hypothetical protein